MVTKNLPSSRPKTKYQAFKQSDFCTTVRMVYFYENVNDLLSRLRTSVRIGLSSKPTYSLLIIIVHGGGWEFKHFFRMLNATSPAQKQIISAILPSAKRVGAKRGW